MWTFNVAGEIVEGDRTQNSAPKWSYARGLATLGRLIADAGQLTVKTQQQVDHLQALAGVRGGIGLIDSDGQTIGEADQVLIAIPAGQAADLLAASLLSPADQRKVDGLIDLLRTAVYRRCWSITLGYEQSMVREQLDELPYYALINSDRRHNIAWLAFEHRKPGHVPPGQAVIIAHMASGYSMAQWDTPAAVVVQEVAKQVVQLLPGGFPPPDWSDTQHWRYSQPDKTIDSATLNDIIPTLWFAGDYLSGGRVHLAAQSGATVAALIG